MAGTRIKPGGMHVVNWRHPIAQGLAMYFPFVEGGGNRTVEAVGEANPMEISTKSAWEVGPPGWAWSPPGDNGTSSSRYSHRVMAKHGGVGFLNCTVGMLVKVQATFTGGGEAYLYQGATGVGGFARFSSEADVNKHFRLDFINNTSFVRLNTGQLTAGEIRSFFVTRVSGSNPNVLTGIWGSDLTTPTYFDRGNASGVCFNTTQVFLGGQTNSGSSRGALCVWWWGVWNRILGADEMQLLHRNPWVLLTKPHLLPEYLFDAAAWASRVQHDGRPAARVVA